MIENKKVPEIRFKGFIERWEQCKLEDLCDIYDGTHQTPNYTNSGIMFLSVENIKKLTSEKFISEEDFKKNFKIYPKKNDILMTRIGDIGTTNIVRDNALKAYYVSLALLKCKNINHLFLNFAIKSNFVQNRLKSRSLLTAIPMKINKDQIGKVDIKYPNKNNEQIKIGTIFESIDNLITLHQRKYETLVNVKKSMLEKMFPKNSSKIPEIRFKGFTEEWEKCKLEELCDIFKGKQLGKKEMLESGKYYVLNGGILPSGYTDNYNANENTISISEGGNSCGYVNLNNCKFWTGGHNYTLQNVKIKTEYLYQFLKFKENDIMALRVGSGLPNIQKNRLEELDILHPCRDEQIELGNLFKSIDNLITLYQCKLEKLNNIKKSMLDKMFV